MSDVRDLEALEERLGALLDAYRAEVARVLESEKGETLQAFLDKHVPAEQIPDQIGSIFETWRTANHRRLALDAASVLVRRSFAPQSKAVLDRGGVWCVSHQQDFAICGPEHLREPREPEAP